MKRYRIGVDVGGTKVAYGLFDENDQLIDRMQHPSDSEADGPAFTDQILDTIRVILEKNGLLTDDLIGVGVCMPSYILFETGHIYLTSSLTKVKDFPMLDYMKARFDTKIVLDNDSNGAALAEYRQGAGRGSRHMVYMAVSTGIGSGIIINGDLFRGSYGWAGEVGHMLITPDEGLLCGCENQGCFMSYASGKYAPIHAMKKLQSGRQSLLSGKTSLSCEEILDAYRKGDALAEETVASMAHYIAVCVYNIYELLNINLFVFGGGLTHFGDALFDRVRAEFDRYNKVPLPVEFRFAELKQDFGIIGAAELVK